MDLKTTSSCGHGQKKKKMRLIFQYWLSLFKTFFFLCYVASVMSDSLWPHGLSSARLLFHGILLARILEWVAISSSRGFFQPRGQTQASCVAGRFFTDWTPREPWLLTQGKGIFPIGISLKIKTKKGRTDKPDPFSPFQIHPFSKASASQLNNSSHYI